MAKDKVKLKLHRLENGEVEQTNRHFAVRVATHKGRRKKIYMHGYLIGLLTGFQLQVKTKLNNNIIVIGGTGTGKSTLVKGMAGVQQEFFGDKILDWENICWTADKFVSQYQDETKKGQPIIYDEGIDSVGALNTSKEGKKVKRTVVTGRFMLRTAYYLTDELQEFAYKMVRDCRALIRVTRRGLRRGYFDVYTDPNKILYIYNGLKFYNKNWRSPEIKNIKPDCKGKFPDYSNIFFDEDEYDKRKLEEVKESDPKEKVDKHTLDKLNSIKRLLEQGKEWEYIADLFGYKRTNTLEVWYSRNKHSLQITS